MEIVWQDFKGGIERDKLVEGVNDININKKC